MGDIPDLSHSQILLGRILQRRAAYRAGAQRDVELGPRGEHGRPFLVRQVWGPKGVTEREELTLGDLTPDTLSPLPDRDWQISQQQNRAIASSVDVIRISVRR